jgi:hypothetical protein
MGFKGAALVLLVAAGVLAGLLIGRVAWQDTSSAVVEVPAGVELSPLEDYALRHGAVQSGTQVATQISPLEDYALRHGAVESGTQVATQISPLEDYALRHMGETP